MHDTAFAIGTKFLELYLSDSDRFIVEVGSCNVNGSLRGSIHSNATYLGLDFDHGPDVDLVIVPEQPLPLRSALADIVISSSQMEHDQFFWQTFLEMIRIVKPGGYLYINAPSNGNYHTYPLDCWRFYPDAGQALARWARSKGFDVTLIESFIADRQRDIWNDFVAVFRVGLETKVARTLLSDLFPCSNVWTARDGIVRNRRDSSEDSIEMQNLKTLLRETEEKLAVANSTIVAQSSRILALTVLQEKENIENGHEELS